MRLNRRDLENEYQLIVLTEFFVDELPENAKIIQSFIDRQWYQMTCGRLISVIGSKSYRLQITRHTCFIWHKLHILGVFNADFQTKNEWINTFAVGRVPTQYTFRKQFQIRFFQKVIWNKVRLVSITDSYADKLQCYESKSLLKSCFILLKMY